MIYPFVVISYLFLLQYVVSNFKFKKDITSIFTSTAAILLTAGMLEVLRLYCQSIFGDVENYRQIFSSIDSLSYLISNDYSIGYFYTDIEVGFGLFISVFKAFSDNFQVFLLTVSIFNFVTLILFCRRFKIELVNVLPIYIAIMFVTFEIGILRQAIAFSFFLMALVYIRIKVLFFLILVLGCTFHLATIFCFFLFWVDKYINRKLFYFIFIGVIALYLARVEFLGSVLGFFELLQIGNSGRIAFYMDDPRPDNYLGIGFWERLIFLILMNLIYEHLQKNGRINYYNNIIYNLGISLILLQMIFFSEPTITSRLRYFVVIFPAIFISQFLYYEYRFVFSSGLRRAFVSISRIVFAGYLSLYLYFLTAYLR